MKVVEDAILFQPQQSFINVCVLHVINIISHFTALLMVINATE